MAFKPTPQQDAVVDAFTKHDGDLVIVAGAGAGKTSTLKLLAAAEPNARGTYIAYNRAIAAEAAAVFPGRVQCKTSHALAYGAVGHRFRHRLQAQRLTGKQQAELLGIRGPHRVSDTVVLSYTQVARIVMQTVARFCYSADAQPNRYHVPRDIPGIAGVYDAQARLEQIVVPYAVKAWNDDITRENGRLRFTPDCYLKMWQLSDPHIEGEYVMLDEAQDTNPCVGSIFDNQTHLLRVAVGDPNQAIYGWRGAVDHMSRMDAKYRLILSQSFRFGQEIADEANKWLSIIGTDLRITGYGRSEVRPITDTVPDAILCRTNAEAVASLIRLHASNVKAALVGGGKDLLDFADAVDMLRDKGWCAHPELSAFQSWGQVQDYVEQDHGGEDFAVAVKLIEKYGTDGIRAAIQNSADERKADVILSTAHKSKGREWDRVRVADDFSEPKPAPDGTDGPIAKPDAMLAYVTVTRAKRVLDRGSLAFIDRYLGGGPKVDQTAPGNTRGGIISEGAHFAYRVKAADGTVLLDWHSNFTDAKNLRDSTPGSTLDSKALNAPAA